MAVHRQRDAKPALLKYIRSNEALNNGAMHLGTEAIADHEARRATRRASAGRTASSPWRLRNSEFFDESVGEVLQICVSQASLCSVL